MQSGNSHAGQYNNNNNAGQFYPSPVNYSNPNYYQYGPPPGFGPVHSPVPYNGSPSQQSYQLGTPAPYPQPLAPYPHPVPGFYPPSVAAPYPQAGKSTGPSGAALHTHGATRDEPTSLPQAFTNMTFNDHGASEWYMDTGATSHLTSNAGILKTIFNNGIISSIMVGDGSSIPITHTGHSHLTTNTRPLKLNHVLVTPKIIKNLIFVR